ncbi:MAG TPA: gliding motility-associated C-terminal domain-containing protein [Candidatus Latescibacteria bacterium]|nr:hypothetical protein [Gemmatimonadota bacterium]HJN29898.1 gliding motility-associated C-terminal domain-containing protein [Candidatus Latescibacterota bacterium]
MQIRRLLGPAVSTALVLLVLFPGESLGFNVYRIGGEDGVPWSAPVSGDPGFYLVLDDDGNIIDRPALTTQSVTTWGDTLTELIEDLDGTWLRPFDIPDTLNLAQDGVRDRIKRGISNNLLTSDSCHNNMSGVQKSRPMFDGDPTTAAFYTANASDDPAIQRGFYIQNTILDFGVNFPINRIRFFPRLGRSNPKFSQILEAMAEPALDSLQLLEEDFSANFLQWFEVAGANAENNFAANCYWATNTEPFFRRIQNISNPESDPRWDIIRKDTENLEVVVDITFPTTMYQWVTFRPVSPIANWEIAEFQVFGEGFVPRSVYTTAVLDFEKPIALGKIRWDGVRDASGRVLIRTRTGSDPDPQLYWEPSSVPGELNEITLQEWERADITARRVTLDAEHWSFWSSPYIWEAGQSNPDLDPALWADGTPIRSPGPAQYLQVQLVFLSEPAASVRLRQLEIQFSEPAALQVVGEVWPLDAERVGSTTFTYSVLPTLDNEQQGFDRLEIFTLTKADSVRALRVDGVDLTSAYPPEIQSDRILVSLPELRGPGDTFKLIEVEFDSRVVRYGTEFTSWVYDSQSSGVRQLVEAGDANLSYPGNALGVRTSDIGSELIAAVDVSPSPFTPNGDGINDVVFFQFQVHELSEPRELAVTVFDLSGRVMRDLSNRSAIRGVFGDAADLGWDGRDESGNLVPTGLYLYRISLQTDSGEEHRQGTLVVVY